MSVLTAFFMAVLASSQSNLNILSSRRERCGACRTRSRANSLGCRTK
jgi:hypothetical protein